MRTTRSATVGKSADIRPGAIVGIEAEGSVAKVQRTNIIKAKDVISMTVSYQDSIQPLQVLTQRLLAKV